MTTPDCPVQFAERILKDLELSKEEICNVLVKLGISRNIYNEKKPTTTLTTIVNDLYLCFKPTSNDIARITSEEVRNTLTYILIVTAIFIVLISLILIVLDPTNYYGWEILISIIFAILYISLVIFLTYNTKLNIDARIATAQNSADKCYTIAKQDLKDYEDHNDTAISDALCAYPSGIVFPCDLIPTVL